MHWLYDPDLSVDSHTLSASEAKHARSLRLEVGEAVVVTNGAGLCVEATIVDETRYSISNTFSVEPPKVRFHLIQALAKGDRDELALQTAVELGASSVTPWTAERSIVRWDGKAEKNQQRWQQIAIEAMKQSQQAHLCKVNPVVTTKQIDSHGLTLVLLPQARLGISDVDLNQEDITLIVGPEGGVSPKEAEHFESKGFIAVRLGGSVLRTSTAGPAAIAAMQFASGNWSTDLGLG
ncbi:MAG: hypothetical protein RL068_129 [Actinomycetota bacterium]